MPHLSPTSQLFKDELQYLLPKCVVFIHQNCINGCALILINNTDCFKSLTHSAFTLGWVNTTTKYLLSGIIPTEISTSVCLR